MFFREDIEKREHMILSPFACKADMSEGRESYEEPCSFRTDFQRDRDRILHTKSFRRLMHKTQVFLAPEGDHFRTRLTHTLEVSQIARTVAKGLGLNEDLTEAIALGHDLGHTPFGHNGEAVLNSIHKDGFQHNLQSLRVVDVLESHNGISGMNLTYEVRDGILNHTGKTMPQTLEGQVVKICDRIAYINHDIDDALRSGVISESDLPAECIAFLGNSHGGRIDRLVTDMIENNCEKPFISQSEECRHYMDKLRNFMFLNVYHSDRVKKAESLMKVEKIIVSLYEYFLEKPEELPDDYRQLIDEYGEEEMVKDYIAGMTDRFSIMMYEKLFTKL